MLLATTRRGVSCVNTQHDRFGLCHTQQSVIGVACAAAERLDLEQLLTDERGCAFQREWHELEAPAPALLNCHS